MEGTQRAMRVCLSREVERLEMHLPFLATVGSISPYIGLFGTVWGIYHALVGIAGAGQLSIAAVAGPIGEALVATAAGLAAAMICCVFGASQAMPLCGWEVISYTWATACQPQPSCGSSSTLCRPQASACRELPVSSSPKRSWQGTCSERRPPTP